MIYFYAIVAGKVWLIAVYAKNEKGDLTNDAKSKSVASSKPLPKRTKKKSTVAEDLIAGLKEIAADQRGEIKLRTRQIVIHGDVDVKAVRERSGLSQSQFADRFGFNSRTLQEWEQGRSQPENAMRAYLKVIDRNANAVEQALFQG